MATMDKDILEQLKRLNSALEDYLDNQDMDIEEDEEEDEEEDVKKSKKPCDKED